MPKERLLYQGTRKIPEIFDEGEINSIFNHLVSSKDYPTGKWGDFMKHRDICLIGSIYILGLRPKEACCLKFSDFNIKNATVKIRGSSNKRKKDRIIPIPSILIPFLKYYFKFPKKRFWKGSPYLFPSCQNNHISPKRIEFIFREKVLKPLKLWDCPKENKKSKTSLYTLRHSRASHILQKQIKARGFPDLWAIANFLGHGDIRSTTVYLHTDKEYTNYLRNEIEI